MQYRSSLPVGVSREEVARIEVGHTTVSPPIVRLLVAGFLTVIVVVPAVSPIGLVFAALLILGTGFLYRTLGRHR